MAANDVITLVFIFSTRGLAPLLLLRWPFFGALACIAADAADTMVQDALGSDILSPHYHNIDKAFDTYYLGFRSVGRVRLAGPARARGRAGVVRPEVDRGRHL